MNWILFWKILCWDVVLSLGMEPVHWMINFEISGKWVRFDLKGRKLATSLENYLSSSFCTENTAPEPGQVVSRDHGTHVLLLGLSLSNFTNSFSFAITFKLWKIDVIIHTKANWQMLDQKSCEPLEVVWVSWGVQATHHWKKSWMVFTSLCCVDCH